MCLMGQVQNWNAITFSFHFLLFAPRNKTIENTTIIGFEAQ